jgi:hypothetical protein
LPKRLSRAQLTALALLGLLLVIALGSHKSPCSRRPIVPPIGDPARPLVGLIEGVPCSDTGHTVYGLRDSSGTPMDVLDPIADPAGGYLGVYDVPSGGTYRILLAHSSDLTHWRRLAVLDPEGASVPTLRAVGSGGGFLLAYEKRDAVGTHHFVRVRYYASQANMIAGRVGASADLPRRFSPFNNGTPWLQSVQWGGNPGHSTITFGFHYELGTRGIPGPDREAVGTLRDFHAWSAQPDTAVDSLLSGAGLKGSHGDARQFAFNSSQWRLYEASSPDSGFAGWHVVLYLVGSERTYPLVLTTQHGTFPASFGNPTAQVLPAPSGHGEVLVVTVFVFSAGPAAGEAGELLFYQPA